MAKGLWRLTRKADVLPPLITLFVCAAIVGIVLAAFEAHGPRVAITTIAVLVVIAVALSYALRVARRYQRLRNGHCPHPLCHGVVQHSDRVPRGMLLCPTCGSKWPEIPGIKFRVTGREHP